MKCCGIEAAASAKSLEINMNYNIELQTPHRGSHVMQWFSKWGLGTGRCSTAGQADSFNLSSNVV